MGLDIYAYCVIGLKLSEQDVYHKQVCCNRCQKQFASSFCPDCGGKIQEQLVMKPVMQSVENLLRQSCESRQWYLVLKKYSTDSNRSASEPSASVPLHEFDISTSQARIDFEAQARALGVWDPNKFGVHIFLYHSY